MMVSLVLACLVTDCSIDGSGRSSAQGAAVVPPAIEARPLKQDLDDLNGALQSLRDAEVGRDLPALYDQVRSDVGRLLKAFVTIKARFEMVIAAGQRRLDDWSNQEETREAVEAHDANAIRRDDLAMAMDSLLLCRMSYGMACAGYRTQIAHVTGALDHRLDLSSIRSVTPAITALLEGEAEVHSIVTDVSAKSNAVIALLAPEAPPH